MIQQISPVPYAGSIYIDRATWDSRSFDKSNEQGSQLRLDVISAQPKLPAAMSQPKHGTKRTRPSTVSAALTQLGLVELRETEKEKKRNDGHVQRRIQL